MKKHLLWLAALTVAVSANAQEQSAYPTNFGEAFVLIGETVDVPIKVTNNGTAEVTSISYTIANDGVVGDEVTIDVPTIASKGKATLNIPFVAGTEATRSEKVFNITKVNGVANQASRTSATGSLVTLLAKVVPVPVVEEFTGTWCGWCPRGFAALQKAHNIYGDDVVLIAVHYNDPMQIDGYAPVLNTVNSFPNAYMNRSKGFDPDPTTICSYIDNAMEKIAPATIKLTAQWSNKMKASIKFQTKTTFQFSADNVNYGIAYVLIEDGLTGSGGSWNQANNYSGRNDAEMEDWTSASSSVSGLEYDHVAVGAWEIGTGKSCSVPSTVVAGEPQEFSFTGSVTSNGVIQDKSKLKAVALLIDVNANTIVNAVETEVLEYGAVSAIDDMEQSGSEEVARYSLDGRRVNASQKGISIVKYADGRTVKTMVK